MVLREDSNLSHNSESDHIERIVLRLNASLTILETDVMSANEYQNEHKDDMAKRVDNFEMQYNPLIKYLSLSQNAKIRSKLSVICSLIKPYLPLCLCGSWFKHGSCDNAFICRCCCKSFEKGIETYYCKNTEACLYWKHGYNLCQSCALMYKQKEHKRKRLTDRIIYRLWNSIACIEREYEQMCDKHAKSEWWDEIVLRYDNCEQYIAKCTYTHWLHNALSVAACLDEQELDEMSVRLNRIGTRFKAHVPVCLCGDIFIYVASPYELDCKHCFKELKESDKTFFCKSRDECTHWNNSYYLCSECVQQLRCCTTAQSQNGRIKERLHHSVDILLSSMKQIDDEEDGKKWLKIAYKVDQLKQHYEKLKVCITVDDDKWCTQFDEQLTDLIGCVKIRVPLCLCGSFFVHETSPIDFRCRHCFKLYDAAKIVIHYCQKQRECPHFNADYYLCNECAMNANLRKSEPSQTERERAFERLISSIDLIEESVNDWSLSDNEWKDISVRLYFYEQQLERLKQTIADLNKLSLLTQKLSATLEIMKQHLATCLCGNLFVSGPSPIDYECRSCFNQCRIEQNIYVCKTKQKCQHWRNHYYICDDCSIKLRKCANCAKTEQQRIVDRLQGAITFISAQFEEYLSSSLSLSTMKELKFDSFFDKIESFETNFLLQMKAHLDFEEFCQIYAKFKELKAYIFATCSSFIDERFRDKQRCNLLCFGYVRNLYRSIRANGIFAAVPDYVFYVALDYFFQAQPQIFVMSMAKNSSLHSLKFDNVEIVDFAEGISSNLRFFDMRSFNKSMLRHRRSSVARHSALLSMQCIESIQTIVDDEKCDNLRLKMQTNKIAANGSISKHKSWNKKDCNFCVAKNVSIPSFVCAIKPSLFSANAHYDILFKIGGYSQSDFEYSQQASALIIDCAHFNHHYSDQYAFKSRHNLWKKTRTNRKRKRLNGYSLSLPCLPTKRGCQSLFDYSRKQLLLYLDNDFVVHSLPFNNSAIKSENEWKWRALSAKNKMKWSRSSPSLSMYGQNAECLFVVGDAQNYHATFGEVYCFESGEWHQIKAQVPFIAHSAKLFNDCLANKMYYIGGKDRNCAYFDCRKLKWFQMPAKTQHIYLRNSCVIWNSLDFYNGGSGSQVLWVANTANCEFFDGRDRTQKWQNFAIDANLSHMKLKNYLNVKFDEGNCDYTLLARI